MILTFDCYGTLIDWESGIIAAVRHAAAVDGVDLEPEAIVAAHAAAEPKIQSEAYRSYREVLVETALAMAGRLGWGALTRERATFLPQSLPTWQPFPDTNPALEHLHAAGHHLGILSNIDDELLRGTQRHFTVDFDLVVTAQQVRSYKPAPAHFREARRRIGRERWLHVAQSYFHDIEPAAALGIDVMWVNRRGERATGRARPTVEVRDLAECAAWIREADIQ